MHAMLDIDYTAVLVDDDAAAVAVAAQTDAYYKSTSNRRKRAFESKLSNYKLIDFTERGSSTAAATLTKN